MGGIRRHSLKHAAIVVPGRIDALTGGTIYDRRLCEGLRERGWQVTVVELDQSFPHPTPAALVQADASLRALAPGTVTLVDGLAFGAMPGIVGAHAERLLFVAIVHLPLAQDVGLDGKVAARLEAEERLSLQSARLAIVTGDATREFLPQYGMPKSRIVLAEPGADPAPVARGSQSDVLGLLCVATINPGKGHTMLIRALAAAPHRQWHLTCVGSLTRHTRAVADLRRVLGECDLLDHVSLSGEMAGAELERSYDQADVFVLPTMKETYGMAVAEAIAHGLPVVSTTTGAIPRLVGRDAGLLVPAEDEPAFTEAIARVLTDEDLRRRLREGAREARTRLPRWQETFDTIAEALDGLEGLSSTR
ncbi:MAG: glycosyltransferase family 4 protein [Vicinamibacterales bacterium]